MPTMSCPRILIADDDPGIREALMLVLRDEGYYALEATTGIETLDILLLSPSPLVVLLDLVMPHMTGFEVLNQVAKDEVLASRHRYIVLSAMPYTNAMRIGPYFAQFVQRLDTPFVSKPFDIDDLLQAVRTAYAQLTGNPSQDEGEQTA